MQSRAISAAQDPDLHAKVAARRRANYARGGLGETFPKGGQSTEQTPIVRTKEHENPPLSAPERAGTLWVRVRSIYETPRSNHDATPFVRGSLVRSSVRACPIHISPIEPGHLLRAGWPTPYTLHPVFEGGPRKVY